MRTVLLLFASNAFMTIAWYGHLKYRDHSLVVVIIASWLIALPEYALQVPANRIGYSQFSATQLKIIQEAISVTVFIIFGYLYLKESPNWRTGLAFLLILAAVALAVSSRAEQRHEEGDKQVAMLDEKLPPPEVK
jgi:uncharacterized protein